MIARKFVINIIDDSIDVSGRVPVLYYKKRFYLVIGGQFSDEQVELQIVEKGGVHVSTVGVADDQGMTWSDHLGAWVFDETEEMFSGWDDVLDELDDHPDGKIFVNGEQYVVLEHIEEAFYSTTRIIRTKMGDVTIFYYAGDDISLSIVTNVEETEPRYILRGLTQMRGII